jgi:biotin carboxyl carrier protein
MSLEIKINDRIARANLIDQNGNILKIEVDGKIYEVDLLHTSDGTFSILEGGYSYNIELVPGNQQKKYTAHTLYDSYDITIIDAESRYLSNRNSNDSASKSKIISSPMPGKIVKIMVKEGDIVKEGETAIIISAMKMESEYKAPTNGLVKKINVSEGETIQSDQILIELE